MISRCSFGRVTLTINTYSLVAAGNLALLAVRPALVDAGLINGNVKEVKLELELVNLLLDGLYPTIRQLSKITKTLYL
jgi:hypothetical protein